VAWLDWVAWGRGGARLSEAQQLMEESLSISREIGQQLWVTICLEFMGHISISRGRYEAAQSYLQEALNLANQLGNKNDVSYLLVGLGEAALGLGNLQAARNYLLEALEIEALETTRVMVALIAMMGWGMLLKQEAELLAAGVAAGHQALGKQEQQQQAVEILSLVLNHPATPHIYKEQAARLLAQLEADLPPEVVAAARERGQARTCDALLEEILAANAG